ncbi:MAG TPA: cytochrome c3 family protein [Gemmatimonadales bacterium]|nr:cytochrome c3 family protein [Gemmatimonadales bacterium]
MKRVAALVGLLWGWSLVDAGSAVAQISPGPLARPHAQLEGARRCVSCHGPGGKEQMSTLCLQCHKDVGWLVQQGRGFHASHRGERCASCHPDHAGREFAMISWPGGDPLRFDHRQAGWPLEGRHASAKCADCHRAAFRVGTAATLAPGPRAGAGPPWIGLEQECTSCHRDVHRGTLDSSCTTCHDVERWKPAPRFDHAKTDYALTGKHRDVPCARCHPSAGGRITDSTQRVVKFSPLPHRDCVACHADPHRGRFTGACGDCHVTTGFTVIDRGHFDHDRTRYPLRGRHASVSCSDCHDAPGVKGKNPPFARCTDCHTDPHAGTATLAGAVVDCHTCHSVQGFAVAAFTTAQHRETKYPLEGAHQRVACVGCHVKNPPGIPTASLGRAAILMRPAFARCLSCHRDDHGGQLAASANGGECAACHTVTGWKPSTYTVADHAKAGFVLDGRHAAIDCASCHGATRTGLRPMANGGALGRARVVFKLAERDCVACHVDPHDGRFARGGARPVADGCLGCHTTERYRPSTIDVAAHAAYAFKLEGAHRAVPCVECHSELRRPLRTSSLVLAQRTGTPLRFTTTEPGCEGCHDSPHGNQFASRPDAGRCESCHGLDAFVPAARFDHDRDTKFPLRGGHAQVPCSQCHPVITGAGNDRIVRYRQVSGRCENCHGEGVRQ